MSTCKMLQTVLLSWAGEVKKLQGRSRIENSQSLYARASDSRPGGSFQKRGEARFIERLARLDPVAIELAYRLETSFGGVKWMRMLPHSGTRHLRPGKAGGKLRPLTIAGGDRFLWS